MKAAQQDEILRALASDLLAPLPRKSQRAFWEPFNHGESGLAFEALIWAIGWNRLPIIADQLRTIDELGRELGYDPADWPGLAKLAEDPNAFAPPITNDPAQARVLEVEYGRAVVEFTAFEAVEALKGMLVTASEGCSEEECVDRYNLSLDELHNLRDAMADLAMHMVRIPRPGNFYLDGTPKPE